MSLDSNDKIINQIMQTLLEPEDRRLISWVDNLCRRNQELHTNPVTGFLHEGIYYCPSNVIYTLAIEKHQLHASLYSEMNTFMRDKTIVELDRSQIKQMLFKLLYPCKTQQEYRDALPDCIASVIPVIGHTPRSKPALWSIKDNERALRQYAQIEPRLEMYVAARMIY